jgi:hypothetical protein
MDIFTEGKLWEAQVRDRLEADGWHVQPYGMDLLSEPLQRAIHDAGSNLEHAPDFLAARPAANRQLGVFVDAKAGRTWRTSGRHCIETDSAVTLDWWADRFGMPVYVVFPDWGVTTPDRILTVGVAGRQTGVGSGKPFLLVPLSVCMDWDALLGRLRP